MAKKSGNNNGNGGIGSSTVKCSFCGKEPSYTDILVPSPLGDAYICSDCVAQIEGLLKDYFPEGGDVPAHPKGRKGTKKDSEPVGKLPTPVQIREFLDQYVIGQDDAKKYLSVAVYNHYKRLAQTSDDVDIEKSNIIMVGPTGTGKTLLAKTIARQLDVPFAIVDATVLTEAGYVGEDIESLLVRLLQAADYDVARAEKGIVFIDEIDKIARKGDNTHLAERSKIDSDNYLKYIAPQDLKSFGLIPEIIGRLPVLVHLDPLDRDALLKVLTEPKNAIIRQYEKLFAMDGVKLTFAPETLEFIVDKAIEYKLGARGLRTIVETVMMDPMYDTPSLKINELVITREFAEEKIKKAYIG